MSDTDFALPPGVAIDDPHARFPSGMEVGEAVRMAAKWWDREGRHVARNPEFRDPDVGIKSGITRGLPFEDLTAREATMIVVAWHERWEREQQALPVKRRLFRP